MLGCVPCPLVTAAHPQAQLQDSHWMEPLFRGAAWGLSDATFFTSPGPFHDTQGWCPCVHVHVSPAQVSVGCPCAARTAPDHSSEPGSRPLVQPCVRGALGDAHGVTQTPGRQHSRRDRRDTTFGTQPLCPGRIARCSRNLPKREMHSLGEATGMKVHGQVSAGVLLSREHAGKQNRLPWHFV